MDTLGKLKQVAIPDVWLREATDFTPWLASAAGLQLLSEALGLGTLSIIAQEHHVGDFRLDILASDEDEGLIVIENQFHRTDHKHLGQLMTYAAGVGEGGLGARAAVWVAESFCEEHRRCLDWLNEISGTRIGFFGVAFELWEIDGSKPAIRFNVVSRPNYEAKRIAAKTSSIREDDPILLKFWTLVQERIENGGYPLRVRSPKNDRGRVCYFSPGCVLRLRRFESSDELRCSLDIERSDAREIMNSLMADRGRLEAEFGQKLEWRTNDLKKRQSVQAIVKGTNLRDESAWAEYVDCLLNLVNQFCVVFQKRLTSLGTTEALTDVEEETEI